MTKPATIENNNSVAELPKLSLDIAESINDYEKRHTIITSQGWTMAEAQAGFTFLMAQQKKLRSGKP